MCCQRQETRNKTANNNRRRNGLSRQGWEQEQKWERYKKQISCSGCWKHSLHLKHVHFSCPDLLDWNKNQINKIRITENYDNKEAYPIAYCQQKSIGSVCIKGAIQNDLSNDQRSCTILIYCLFGEKRWLINPLRIVWTQCPHWPDTHFFSFTDMSCPKNFMDKISILTQGG